MRRLANPPIARTGISSTAFTQIVLNDQSRVGVGLCVYPNMAAWRRINRFMTMLTICYKIFFGVIKTTIWADT